MHQPDRPEVKHINKRELYMGFERVKMYVNIVADVVVVAVVVVVVVVVIVVVVAEVVTL